MNKFLAGVLATTMILEMGAMPVLATEGNILGQAAETPSTIEETNTAEAVKEVADEEETDEVESEEESDEVESEEESDEVESDEVESAEEESTEEESGEEESGEVESGEEEFDEEESNEEESNEEESAEDESGEEESAEVESAEVESNEVESAEEESAEEESAEVEPTPTTDLDLSVDDGIVTPYVNEEVSAEQPTTYSDSVVELEVDWLVWTAYLQGSTSEGGLPAEEWERAVGSGTSGIITFDTSTNTLLSLKVDISKPDTADIDFYTYIVISSIDIPSTLKIDGADYPILTIGDKLCYGVENLLSVTIAEGVVDLGKASFAYCTDLKKVSIPSSATKFHSGNNPLLFCPLLTSAGPKGSGAAIEFGHTTEIHEAMFRSLYDLETVILPDSITTIGEDAFYNCSSLNEINMPTSLESIGNRAFYKCTSLTEAILPDSLVDLGRVVFAYCSKLEKVYIPDSITEFHSGNNPLLFCPLLTSAGPKGSGAAIEFSHTTEIHEAMFRSLYDLETVILPDSITTIGEDAFYNCSSLNEINMPTSLESIGKEAFYKCTSLTEAILPDSLVEIGSTAFGYCTKLAKVYIPSSITTFHKGYPCFYGCTSLTSAGPVGSGSQVEFAHETEIPDYMFESSKNLEILILPESIESVGQYAFYNTALTDVYYTGSQSDWDAIDIERYNDPLLNAKRRNNYQLVDGASTVTFNPDGGGFPKELSGEIEGIYYSRYAITETTDEYGYFDEFPIPVQGGHEFLYWQNLSGEIFTEESQFTSDQSLTAIWEECEHFVITFDYGQDDKIELLNTNKDNTLYWLAAAGEREGHFFEGWQTEVNGEWVRVSTSYVFTQDTTVYPNWKAENEVELGLIDMGDIVLQKNEYAILITENGVKPCTNATVKVGGQDVSANSSIIVLTMPDALSALGISIEKDKFFPTDNPYFTPEAGKAYFYALESEDTSIAITSATATLQKEGTQYNLLTDAPTIFAANTSFSRTDYFQIEVEAVSAADLDIISYTLSQKNGNIATIYPENGEQTFSLNAERRDTGELVIQGLTAGQTIYLTAKDELGNTVTKPLSIQINTALNTSSSESVHYNMRMMNSVGSSLGSSNAYDFLDGILFNNNQFKVESGLFPISFFYDEADGIYRYVLNFYNVNTTGNDRATFEQAKSFMKTSVTSESLFGVTLEGSLQDYMRNYELSAGYDKFTELQKSLLQSKSDFQVGNLSVDLDLGGYLQINTKNEAGEKVSTLEGETALFVMGSITPTLYQNWALGVVPMTAKLSATLGIEARAFAEIETLRNVSDELEDLSFFTYVSENAKALQFYVVPQTYLLLQGGIGATINSNSTSFGPYGDMSSFWYVDFDKAGALKAITFLAGAGFSLSVLGEDVFWPVVTTQGEQTLWERTSSSSSSRAYTLSTMNNEERVRTDSSDVTAVKENSLTYTQPQLVTVGNTKYLFWLDDAGSQRTDVNCSTIFYATSSDGVNWSEPMQIFEESVNHFAQFNLSLAVDGEDIHLSWLQGTEVFEDGIDVIEKATKVDAYHTVLNTSTMNLAEPTRITENDKYEGLTTFSEDGSMLLWLENDLSKGVESILAVDANNTLCYAYTNDLDNPVTVLTNANLGSCVIGKLGATDTIAYLEVDESAEDNDSGYITTLKLYDISTKTTKEVASGAITGLTFVSGSLYWMIDNDIYNTTNGSTVITLLDEEDDYLLPTDFLILEEDNKTYLVYGGSSEGAEEGSPVMTIYVSEKTTTGWSPAYELFQTDSKTMYNLSGYVENGMFHLAYLERNDDYASVMVTHVEPKTELSVDFIHYEWEDIELGKPLDLFLSIKNTGGVPLEKFYVYVDDVLVDTINCTIPIGRLDNFTSSGFTLPSTLNGVTEYVVKVVASPDDLSTTEGIRMALGYTDLQISAIRQKVNSNEFVVLTMENLTNIPADATLNVYRDSWEGDVVFTKDFSNLTKDGSIMQILDLSTIELTLDARIDDFYFEILPTTVPELYENDNKVSVYLGMNREVLSTEPEVEDSEDDLSFTINFDANGGSVSTSSATTNSSTGKLSSLPTATRTGYTLNGWYTTSSGGTKVSTSTVFDKNTTVYAQWTSSSDDTTVIPPTTPEVEDDTTVTPPTTTTPDSNTSTGGSSSSGSSSSSTPTTYSNTITKPENGTVTLNPTAPVFGDSVTLTVTPDSGYEVESVSVKRTSNGSEVEVTKQSDGTYRFTQPYGRVNIEVEFVKIGSNTNSETVATPSSTPRFSDVSSDDWFYDAVEFVAERGLMSGTGEGGFEPYANTTRGMIVTVLHSLAGYPEFTSNANFTDISSGDWYYNVVSWAKEVGITSGMTTSTFEPNGDMTREQLVVMLYAYEKKFGKNDYEGELYLAFNDNDSISNWAEEAVAWSVAMGIVGGRDTGDFDPQATASRAEVAIILKNFVNLYN